MQTPRAGKQFFLWWDTSLSQATPSKNRLPVSHTLKPLSMWLHESNPHFRRRVRKDFFVLVGLYLSVFCLLFQPKQGGKHVSSWQNEGKSYQTNKPTSFSIWTNRHAVILDSCLYFSDCLLHCSSFNGSEKETQYAHWVETSCFLGIDITVLLMGTLSACCSLSSWLTHAVFFVLKGLRAV